MATILVPTSGLDESFVVERYAVWLADKLGYDIKMLFVADTRRALRMIGEGAFERELGSFESLMREKAKKELEIFHNKGLKISTHVARGIPSEVIGDIVREDKDIKLVVLGHKQRGWIESMVEGSVSDNVYKMIGIDVPCPVLIVPNSIEMAFR